MVFCYKIITDTPRRSGSLSPRKCSPMGRLPDIPSSFSELISSFEYEPVSGRLDWIPEREWRLLGALARKREEDVEREELADQFRRLWQKEREERDQVLAQTSEQYNRYLVEKREQEHLWYEYKRLERISEQQARTGRLMDYIRRKDHRSAEMVALANDKKTHEQIDKQLEEDARAFLAADRRTRLGAADEWRKRVELVDRLRRVEDARTRRDAMLKDTSQRLAINNALSSWETSLLRQEVTAMDLAKRAQHAAHAALTNARSIRLARARDMKQRRARRVAAYTAQLREAVRRKY